MRKATRRKTVKRRAVDRRHQAQTMPSVSCAVITVSDSRTPQDDFGGQYIRDALRAAGHEIHAYEIMRDELTMITERLRQLIEDRSCMAVVLTGGTGLAPRDQTFEAVTLLLEKTLHGFGELFRMLSFEQIGPLAMLSRAVAGVAGDTLIFSLPGAPAAVELAMQELILPTLNHAVALIRGTAIDRGGGR